jgi:hypothetical protein
MPRIGTTLSDHSRSVWSRLCLPCGMTRSWRALWALLGLMACCLVVSAPALADSDGPGSSPFSWPPVDEFSEEESGGMAEPSVCGQCKPPLLYAGGAILGTPAQAGELTVTTIYWFPPGYTLTPQYKQLIDQYVTDVAADSGKGSNVFSVNAEYYRAESPAAIKYLILRGQASSTRRLIPQRRALPRPTLRLPGVA